LRDKWVAAQTSSCSEEGGHVLALDNSWNCSLEASDTRALDMLLADSFVSIDMDGSIATKRESLGSLKSPGYQAPAQAVTEQSRVDVHGNSAIVTGVFRTQTVARRLVTKLNRGYGGNVFSTLGSKSAAVEVRRSQC